MSCSLTRGCSVCPRESSVSRCAACKVVSYCRREHQIADWARHKQSCKNVKKAQRKLDQEERILRDSPGDMFTPANVFQQCVGHFWGIYDTRSYMRARFGVIDALMDIWTYDAVNSSLEHALDTLRLCRGDNLGIRDFVPALFLRLGRDQECYDLVKWWATTGNERDYDWGDMDLPYLDTWDADVFESVDDFAGSYLALCHSVAVALLKIRLLVDVKSLQMAASLCSRVPPEVVRIVSSKLASPVVARNRDVMNSGDVTPVNKSLRSQIIALYDAVDKANEYFWPTLVRPGRHLKTCPDSYSHGSVEEMQLALKACYRAWAETPGAIEIIGALAERRAS